MERKYFFLAIIIIALFPLALNLIITLPAPFSIPVVGDAGVWLQFWGSYIGGIVTASIGFYTLHINEKRTMEREMATFKEERAKNLQNELIRRMTSLNYGLISHVLDRLETHTPLEEANREIVKLEELKEATGMEYIGWEMMPWHDMPSKPSGFDEKYGVQILAFQSVVEKTILLLERYCSLEPSEKFKQEDIDTQKHTISVNTAFLMQLVKEAKEWIMKEGGL